MLCTKGILCVDVCHLLKLGTKTCYVQDELLLELGFFRLFRLVHVMCVKDSRQGNYWVVLAARILPTIEDSSTVKSLFVQSIFYVHNQSPLSCKGSYNRSMFYQG